MDVFSVLLVKLLTKEVFLVKLVKRIVFPKVKILTLITYVIPNLYEFLSAVEQK